MIATEYLSALWKICNRLEGSQVNWVVTGSLGMALQGVPVAVGDIDIQTDKAGAYEIEGRFAEAVVKPVRYAESKRIRSYFGMVEVDGLKVEIMGNLQKRLDDQGWEAPVKVEDYREWVEIERMRVPVLSLAYEYQAYLKLGRREKAEVLRRSLEKRYPKRTGGLKSC